MSNWNVLTKHADRQAINKNKPVRQTVGVCFCFDCTAAGRQEKELLGSADVGDNEIQNSRRWFQLVSGDIIGWLNN